MGTHMLPAVTYAAPCHAVPQSTLLHVHPSEIHSLATVGTIHSPVLSGTTIAHPMPQAGGYTVGKVHEPVLFTKESFLAYQQTGELPPFPPDASLEPAEIGVGNEKNELETAAKAPEPNESKKSSKKSKKSSKKKKGCC